MRGGEPSTFQHHLQMEYIYMYMSMDAILNLGSYQDIIYRGLLPTKKVLLNLGFLIVKTKSSLRKFYDLVNRYGIYVSQMITDLLRLP